MLDRLDKDCLDMERRRQSLCRIDPKRQVLALGRGSEEEGDGCLESYPRS